jgi:hypothetical protein
LRCVRLPLVDKEDRFRERFAFEFVHYDNLVFIILQTATLSSSYPTYIYPNTYPTNLLSPHLQPANVSSLTRQSRLSSYNPLKPARPVLPSRYALAIFAATVRSFSNLSLFAANAASLQACMPVLHASHHISILPFLP